MPAPHMFMVVCRYGLMGIYHDLEDAKAEAREIHESDEDEEFYIPVWVRATTFDESARVWDVGMFPDRTTNETPGRWVSATTRDGKSKPDYPNPKGLGWVFRGKTKIEKLREKEARDSAPDPAFTVTYNLGVDLKLEVTAPRSAMARAWGDEKIGSAFKGTLDDGSPFEAVVLHGDRVACEKSKQPPRTPSLTPADARMVRAFMNGELKAENGGMPAGLDEALSKLENLADEKSDS